MRKLALGFIGFLLLAAGLSGEARADVATVTWGSGSSDQFFVGGPTPGTPTGPWQSPFLQRHPAWELPIEGSQWITSSTSYGGEHSNRHIY